MEEVLSEKGLNGVKIVSEKHDIKEFLQFPYHHYKHDKHWIAPLYIEEKKLINPNKNPFFNDAEMVLFTAHKNGEIAGRIAAIDNRVYNIYHKSNIGFFGFFECIDDSYLASLLFRVASDWCKKKGFTSMIGPFSPSNMDLVGVLVDGFERDPSIYMPYSKPYYDKLITSCGLEKAMDLFAYNLTRDTINSDRILKGVEIIKKRLPSSLKIREANLKMFDREVVIIRDIFNKAWAENWGFHPVSKEVFAKLGKDLKSVLDTKFAHIAEIDGKPVAFSITLPDFNQALKQIDGKLLPLGIFKLLYYSRKIDRLRTALMGVIPEFQGRGIDVLMYKEAIVNGLDKGYQSAELSWVLESNTNMIRVAERIGAYVEKTYRVYSLKL